MTQPSTPGKVLVYKKDGEVFERWPVDAREMVATGDYTHEAPTGAGGVTAPPAPAPDPVPHKTAAEKALAEHPHNLINRQPEPPPAAIPPPEAPAIASAPPAPAPSAPEPEWKLKVTPEAYLNRNPDGPNAELALAVIAAR